MWQLTQLFSFIFYATADISELEKEVVKIIPKGYKIEDIVEGPHDFLVLAWDLNNRNPRFFSKWADKNFKGKDKA